MSTVGKFKFIRLVYIFLSAAILTTASIIVVAYLNQDQATTPTATSQTEEESGITTVKLSGEEGNGTSASLEYSGYITYEKSKNLITLNFANPTRSSKNLSLSIVADIDGENITLAQTSIIQPGNKIISAQYEAEKDIAIGKYTGKYVVYFYNENNEEEMVNTEIPIDIYVK